ncbi:MAG TPA: hypothetical protein VGO86_12055 [Candidatus Dormibacteraeota bacterium]
MRVGATGHRMLPPGTARLVEEALRRRLAPEAGPSLVGISLLADGADQLFADMVLALGGSLEVVVPATHYREALPADCRQAYDRQLAQATTVERLDHRELTTEALMAAGRRVVERSELLLAIWDGRPARGMGGTGDVVEYAKRTGVPVEVVWPSGASRS